MSLKAANDRFVTRHASLMPSFAALGVLVALLVAAQLYFGDFVSPGNMSALLLDNAYLMVLAVGMTFVILTGGIDLSVGSVMAFTGILLRQPPRARDAGRGRGPGHPPGGRRDRPPHRRPRPVLRRPAVHRLAGGTVPRPWSGVRGQPQVDPRRRPRCAVAAVDPVPGRGLVHHPHRHHRPGGRGDRRLRPAVHAFRSHRLRDRRQRAVGAADGPEGGPHQGVRLRDQRQPAPGSPA